MNEPRKISRRRVLRGAGVGAATIVVVGTGAVSYRAYDNQVFDSTGGEAFDAWRHWREDPGPRGTVAAAVLAASPHNTQPWLFRINGSRIDLYGDQSRRTATLDPYRREFHIGLGCALENLVLAARERGAEPRVTLLPDAGDPLHVARVELVAGSARHSELYDAIGDRHTNRGPYTDEPLPDGLLAELTSLADTHGPAGIHWVTDQAARTVLGELMVDAARAVTADEAQSKDGFAWFRNDADAIDRHRDGLTLDAQGLGDFKTAIAKILPATSRTSGDSFWVDQTRTVHTRTAAAYGILFVPDPHDPAQQLTGGRLLQRIHLAVTARGLALQHMNQITERIDRDLSLGHPPEFGPRLTTVIADPTRRPLATFRLGHPLRDPGLSPRRPAAAVMIT